MEPRSFSKWRQPSVKPAAIFKTDQETSGDEADAKTFSIFFFFFMAIPSVLAHDRDIYVAF